MDIDALGPHISHRFDEELEQLRKSVLQMGGLVEGQLTAALDALRARDTEAAEQVIADDRKINTMELDIDDECMQLLARRQPVASDLRLVFTIIKANTDLERMGDEAVRIARMALRRAGSSVVSRKDGRIRQLGRHVRQMVRDALDSFARLDLELAAAVVEADTEVDEEYDRMTRELITFMMEDPRLIPDSLQLQWAARALERIGDRACNIAEYVVYLKRGTDVRHVDREQIRKELESGGG